jgi:hypothetical protein
MGMVAPERRIASAFFVVLGEYGAVTRHANEEGISRQVVYREAKKVQDVLDAAQEKIHGLEQRVRELQQQQTVLEQRLAQAVVLDEEKQAEFAVEGQARGVGLANGNALMNVLIPGHVRSVPTLGRRVKAAEEKAGPLLAVLDEFTRPLVRDGAADELYVNDPVLMTVEQESLCWLTGHLSDKVDGETWAKEFRQFPNLEQMGRDGGTALAKGVALVNAERAAQGQPPVVDQGDHFHALRGAGVGLRRAQMQARKTLAAAEEAQQQFEECQRQGQPAQGPGHHARSLWGKAEQAMDAWSALEKTWQQTKEAMRLITPTGELNTRAQAEAVLAQTLPQLPDSAFAKTKRQLQKPEMLNYLDHVHDQIEALPFPAAVKQAAVRQESLKRQPEVLKGENPSAAALRGVLLVCAVVLAKSDEVNQMGQQAVAAVRDIFRRAYRASSLVECINSAIRMHQYRHRRMTQGLLDLKRLYWNCHTFRTGHRRGTTPYQRLGVPWPAGLRWWDVLKLTPEQLRDKLSTAKMAP